MEPEPPKKNPKKLIHGICFQHIFLSQSKRIASFDRRERATLLKYFPKHIKDLRIEFSEGPLNTKIKHLKLIQNLSCSTPHDNFWRLVIVNKRKTVQSFRQGKDELYSKLNVQCLKMFPNTKMVKLCLEDREEFSDEEWDQQLYWINRIPRHLNNLYNLKYLKIFLLSQDLFGSLSKLKRSERILSQLKAFDVNLTWPDHGAYEALQKLLTYKDILKYITNLSLGMLAGKDFFEAFQILSESCPRLTDLSFGTSQKEFHLNYQYEFQDDIILKDFTHLKCLQNFSNLKTLNIRACHGFDLLQYCQFPTSLRQLYLSLWKVDWNTLIESSSKGFSEFNSQQPENLQNLEILQVAFNESCDDSTRKKLPNNREIAINAFLQAFLKRILKCRELDLVLSSPYAYQNEFKESPFPIDVVEFIKYFEHLGQSLVMLNISDKSREYYFNNFNTKADAFPSLSSFSIASEISPSIDFENIFNFVQSKGENDEVILDGIKVKSSEEFLNLLKKLGKLKNIIAEKERVELVVYCQDFEGDGEYFEKNYEDVKNDIGRLKNVFMTLRIKKSDSKFSGKLKSFKPSFGDLQIRGKNDWERL